MSRLPSTLPFFMVTVLAAPLFGCTGNLDGSHGGGEVIESGPDDGAAPTILLVEPTIGSVMPGAEVRLVGRVDDASAVTLTTDRGETVPVAADGSFDYPIVVAPGAHRIRLVAEDSGGRTGETFTAFMSGTFVPDTTVVEDAVLADMSAGVLDEIAAGAAATLTAMSFDAEVQSGNPIADGWWGDLDVRGEEHGQVTITLTPTAGHITATVEVASIRVDARADLRIGSASGELRADRVRVTADISLTAIDGRLEGAIMQSSTDISGVVLDVNNFPDAIENLDAVRSRIEDLVQDALDDAVADMLPGLIADGLASIPEGDTVEILDTPLALTVGVGAVALDPGGIGAAVDLGLRAVAPVGSRGAVGYLSIPRSGVPPRGGEVSIAIAYDALNAAFSALWAGGGLDQRIDDLEFGGGPLTAGTLALLLPFTAGSAPADAPMAIDIAPRLAPVLVPGPTGGLEVQAADVRITFVALTDGGEIEMASLSVGAFAEALPRAFDGSLEVRLGELRLSADVIDAGPRAPTGDDLDALVAELMETAAPDLLAGAALAVPSLYGFDLEPTSVGVDGGYITLNGDIAYLP